MQTTNGTILVIEDDHMIRESLKELLEGEDYTVHTAQHGKHALEILRSADNQPDIILLDLFMPVMDGVTFLETFKKLFPHLAHTPIFIMSAAGRNSESLPKNHDPEKIYYKPLDVDHLLRSIKQVSHRNI